MQGISEGEAPRTNWQLNWGGQERGEERDKQGRDSKQSPASRGRHCRAGFVSGSHHTEQGSWADILALGKGLPRAVYTSRIGEAGELQEESQVQTISRKSRPKPGEGQ